MTSFSHFLGDFRIAVLNLIETNLGEKKSLDIPEGIHSYIHK